MSNTKYRCLDCTHVGGKFTGGVCPACGSVNVKRITPLVTSEKKARNPFKFSLGMALWFFLLFELYRVHFSDK